MMLRSSYLPAADPGGDEERLHGRAGLEDVGRGAVAIRARRHVIAVVRVVGGLIHHGEYFAGRDIEHDDGAASGAVVADGGLQLPIGEVLNAQIDRQHEIAAGTDGTYALHVLARCVRSGPE